VAALLASQPKFTAFHEEGVIAYHDAVHLGVALDLGSGLRVVTLRDAASMDAAGLGARLAELALACAENRLQPADVQGATFTVTDLSALDVLHFAPLLNARQSAILAVGGDATLPGHPMSLTLAFDHRVANGREAGLFLRALRDRLLARADSQWPVGPAPAPAPASASARVAPVGSAPACDRCLIELPAYYEQFGRWGVMHQYLRPDGTPGLICHACLGVS
jgi:2-oxoglutarate dehydrogenase E2 component (dihydrolipoamide succinyltransferase)